MFNIYMTSITPKGNFDFIVTFISSLLASSVITLLIILIYGASPGFYYASYTLLLIALSALICLLWNAQNVDKDDNYTPMSFMHKTLLFAPLVLMILALGFSIYLFFTYSNIILSGNISEKYNTYSLIANIIYLTQIGFIFKWFTYSLLSTIKNVVFSNKSNVIGITQSKFFIGEMSIFGIINMVFIYLMYEILSKFTTGG
jgi:hypothetical protein